MITRDALTGAGARDQWPVLVQQASSYAAAGGAWVALIDIDRFKRFNMHNGHATGDQVLVRLATFLLSLEDQERFQVVRTGGEEFALIAREGTAADNGRTACERILTWARASLTPEQPQHCGASDCVGPTHLTVSMALGRIERHEDPASLTERLATAILEAKRAGGDRIQISDFTSSTAATST